MHEPDEALRQIAGTTFEAIVDFDNATGWNDQHGGGVYYKISRSFIFPIYMYYQTTGDERAREIVLRAMDHKFRFKHTLDRRNFAGSRCPTGCQHLNTFLVSFFYTTIKPIIKKVDLLLSSA